MQSDMLNNVQLYGVGDGDDNGEMGPAGLDFPRHANHHLSFGCVGPKPDALEKADDDVQRLL